MNYPKDSPSQTDNASLMWLYGQQFCFKRVKVYNTCHCVRNSTRYFQRAQSASIQEMPVFFCHSFLFRRLLKPFYYIKRLSFVPKLLIYRTFSMFRSWICDFVVNKVARMSFISVRRPNEALSSFIRSYSIKCLCIRFCRFGVAHDNYYGVHSFCAMSTSTLR